MTKSEPSNPVQKAQQAAQALMDEELPAEWKEKLHDVGLLDKEQMAPHSEAVIGLTKVMGKILKRLQELERFANDQSDSTVLQTLITLSKYKGQPYSATVYAAEGKAFSQMSPVTRLFLQQSRDDESYAADYADSLRTTADSIESFLKKPDMETRLLKYREKLADKPDILADIAKLFGAGSDSEAQKLGVENPRKRVKPLTAKKLEAMRGQAPETARVLKGGGQILAAQLAGETIDRIRNAPTALRVLADVVEQHYGPRIDQVMSLITAQIPERGEGRQGGR